MEYVRQKVLPWIRLELLRLEQTCCLKKTAWAPPVGPATPNEGHTVAGPCLLTGGTRGAQAGPVQSQDLPEKFLHSQQTSPQPVNLSSPLVPC